MIEAYLWFMLAIMATAATVASVAICAFLTYSVWLAFRDKYYEWKL